MKKTLMLLAVMVVLFNISKAQYIYKPLTCSGDVTKDFLTDFSSFENTDFDNIDKSSAVFLSKVLRSGKVLFGDEVSLYVSKVLDELMKNDPNLRKEIRVYLLKEADFNAYTTFNGIIFINLGLIAQLETEAQLASILAHEVTHYQQKHSVAFGKKKKVLHLQNGAISEENNYQLYSFSKLQELEANRLGYTNYLVKSDYNTSAAFEAIELMIYSHLPFDEVPISLEYLKFSNITFPSEYNLEKVTEIESID